MKDNGFTLVELLVVIVLIGIVATIAVTGIVGNQRRLQEDLFCDKVEFIEQGAILWGQDNESTVTNKSMLASDYETGVEYFSETISGTTTVDTNAKLVTVNLLLSSNYLKSDVDSKLEIVDPRDDTVNLNGSKVKIYMKNKRIYADYVYANADEEALCETK